MNLNIEPSSFRDRDGFIFYQEENVYRQINESYIPTWNKLKNETFFTNLINDGKLVAFEEVTATKEAITIKLQKIPFISYPSEWTFNQLKKAALLTLAIQKTALQNNFTLKDATAYNVQFVGSKAIFIDTLSFEPYTQGEPWQAYKQFCQHFLSPLLLAYYGKSELKSLFLEYMDGIPLRVSAKLLPIKSKFNLLSYTHIHLHAKFEQKHSEDTNVKANTLAISKARILSIIEHLESGIKNLKIKKSTTNWTDYYATCSYSAAGYQTKQKFVEHCLSSTSRNLCVDLGANTGEFSKLASKYFKTVIACDSDLEVVAAIQHEKINNVLALHVNLTNPTPAFGWNNEERKSFISRIKNADITMALALIHHLCIGNNVPLNKVAHFFSDCSQHLIIEFVPKNDVQVKKLLVTKKDIFDDYTLDNFKRAFLSHFTLVQEQTIPDSDRILFLFQKK